MNSNKFEMRFKILTTKEFPATLKSVLKMKADVLTQRHSTCVYAVNKHYTHEKVSSILVLPFNVTL